MEKKINIGVLGCANIAQRYIIPSICKNNLFQLVGVASRSKKKADSVASLFNTKAYYSYESLLELDLDAIYIPLPNGLHYEWIKKALNKNIHVLVEKSLACNFAEVQELNLIAKNNGLVLMENFQFRFHKQLKFIQDEIDRGKLGEIKLLRSSFGFPPFSDKDNIRYQKAIGGGALLDAGAYTIKIAQIFLGSAIYIEGASLDKPFDKEVDISGSAYIKLKKSYVTAQIAFGFDHFYQNSLEIWGSKGKLTASRIFTAGPGIKATVRIEGSDGYDNLHELEDDHFHNMLNHFSKLIHTGIGIDNEYDQNENQARLIGEIFEKSIVLHS
jgi:NDP-hexose-3-ketoreductase